MRSQKMLAIATCVTIAQLASGNTICSTNCCFAQSPETTVSLKKEFSGTPSIFMRERGRIGTIEMGSQSATVRLFDAGNGAEVRGPVVIPGTYRSSAMSENCKVVALVSQTKDGSDHVLIWDLIANRQISTFVPPHNEVGVLAFVSGNTQVIVGFSRKHTNTFSIWDIKSAKRVGTLPEYAGVAYCGCPSPSGKEYYVWGNGGGIVVYDVNSRKQVRKLQQSGPFSFDSLQSSLDGKLFVVIRTRFFEEEVDGQQRPKRTSSIVCIDAESGLIKGSVEDPLATPPLAIGLDNKQFLTKYGESRIRKWSTESGKMVSELALESGDQVLEISRDGRTVVVLRKGILTLRQIP